MDKKSFISQFDRTDIRVESSTRVYDGFFKVDEVVLKHALFAGGESEPVKRELLERGDAVAILPYDPKTNRLIFIEQLRIGAYRSSASPWLLEVIAGMIDKPESAEEVAIREAEEEAGLTIERLVPMLNYLSSPGGTTERLYLFLGVVDSEGSGGIFGLPQEQEDIKVHVIDFDESMALLQQGIIDNAATVICLQWLALNKGRIDSELEVC